MTMTRGMPSHQPPANHVHSSSPGPGNAVLLDDARIALLVGLIVRVLVLVPRHVSGPIDQILPAGYPLALARLIEALLARARVLRGVR